MRRLLPVLLLPILLLLAAGCASMSENECRAANWASLGERDGVSGNRPRIDQYAYQCGQFSVAASERDYMEGWWVGNAEFVRRADSFEGTD
ncbi:MAG TPA: DUF2799 domain-containing protein [Burkholderiales bacterium]|jgi:hypothetical protein|nr:DUF2799 domain-containing protein [Burkholderiales bacterium]